MRFPTIASRPESSSHLDSSATFAIRLAFLIAITAIAIPALATPLCSRTEEELTLARQFLPPGAGPDLCTRPFGDEGELLVVLYPFRQNESRTVGVVLVDTATRKAVAHAHDELGIEADAVASMEFLQIDGDGYPEIIAHLPVGVRKVATWILRWKGTTIENLTPREPNGFSRLVGFHEFVDIDHDGQLEIISWQEDWPQVYELGPSGFTDDAERCTFVSPFERSTSEPIAEERVINAPPGIYVLNVTNGTDLEETRVTSGEILIDGRAIVNPGDFKRKETVFAKEIELANTSILTVLLRGKPGSVIAVRICQPTAR